MGSTNDNVVSLPNADEIEMQAAAWIALLEREDVTHEDRTELRRWLHASERHRAAFQSLAALWNELEILNELNDIAQAHPYRQARNTARRWRIVGVAASLVLAIAAGMMYYSLQAARSQQDGVFATAVGEQRSVELADGSTIKLNTNSRIEVAYSRQERLVLLTRGEAYFDVAKSMRRPFAVRASDNLVHAVGTAFSVRLRNKSAVEVTVEEGRVALASLAPERVGDQLADDRLPLAQLSAGQSTIFNKQVEKIVQMPTSELDRKLAWRNGLLAYAGEPLAEVIEDISRYTDIRIEIVDHVLAVKPVAGYFRVGQIDALFESLELNFGVEVEHVSSNYVRLSEAS